MDDALVRIKFVLNEVIYQVLILVVMDDALVPIMLSTFSLPIRRLNPCCNG